MAQTATKTRLTVVTTILDQAYQTGQTATDELKQERPIHIHEYRPQ
ncbi:MAG: hypothetical protein AAGG53_11730 [Cyanobacteria bacterium P01_H01_bin.152]